MGPSSINVKCNRCGWVHFSVTREYVEQWESDWKQRWTTMSAADKRAYGCEKAPPNKQDEYMSCHRCGNPETGKFEIADEKDMKAIYGSTISGILWEPKIPQAKRKRKNKKVLETPKTTNREAVMKKTQTAKKVVSTKKSAKGKAAVKQAAPKKAAKKVAAPKKAAAKTVRTAKAQA